MLPLPRSFLVGESAGTALLDTLAVFAVGFPARLLGVRGTVRGGGRIGMTIR